MCTKRMRHCDDLLCSSWSVMLIYTLYVSIFSKGYLPSLTHFFYVATSFIGMIFLMREKVFLLFAFAILFFQVAIFIILQHIWIFSYKFSVLKHHAIYLTWKKIFFLISVGRTNLDSRSFPFLIPLHIIETEKYEERGEGLRQNVFKTDADFD